MNHLYQQWRSQPPADHPFYVSPDCSLTYGEMEVRMEATFRHWQPLGLHAGDTLFLAVSDELLNLLSVLTALRYGLTLMMWNPHAPLWETEKVLDLAQPACLCLDESLLQSWNLAQRPLPARGMVVVDDQGMTVQVTAQAASLPASTQEESPAYVLFTSGTTDLPKGVTISGPALAAHLHTLSRHFGYSATSRLLNPLPWHHADGLVGGPLLAWYNGATLVRPHRFTPHDVVHLLERVAKERITHLIGVPTLLALMARLGTDHRHAFKTPWFEVMVSTGGKLEENLWRTFEEQFQVPVANIYGLTETVVGGIFCGPNGASRRVGSLGKPVDCTVEIRSPEGEVLGENQMGELWITGANLMSGYLNQPEATRTVMEAGWFRSGDLISRDEEGFYHFHGRQKNVLMRGGFPVFPEQIAEVLNLHPQVAEAVVIGRPDPIWEEVPVAFVVLHPGAALTGKELAAFCRTRLSEYKIPKTFYWVDHLPKGPAGKILLAQVRSWLQPVEKTVVSSALNIPQQVAVLASGCFNVSVTTLNDHSTPGNTTGWDSLSFMELVVQLEEHFNMILAVQDILKMESLGAIQRLVIEYLQQREDPEEQALDLS